jgi:hypothetical protein
MKSVFPRRISPTERFEMGPRMRRTARRRFGEENVRHAGAHSLAARMRDVLALAPEWAARESSWDNAFRRLRERGEEIGVLIIVNGGRQ